VWALRAQTDKLEYAASMRRVLEETPNLSIREGASRVGRCHHYDACSCVLMCVAGLDAVHGETLIFVGSLKLLRALRVEGCSYAAASHHFWVVCPPGFPPCRRQAPL
jgi:hypothetical protein